MPKTALRNKTLSDEDRRRLEQELTAARTRLGPLKQRLQWYLDFIEMDLAQLPPSERAILSYNLWAGAGASANEWGYLVKVPAEPMSIARLKSIQGAMKHGLAELFSDARLWLSDGPQTIALTRLSDDGAKATQIGFTMVSTGKRFEIHGFVAALRDGAEFIRTCTHCKKPFVATKRQEYCSTNCSQIERNEKKKKLRIEDLKKQSK